MREQRDKEIDWRSETSFANDLRTLVQAFTCRWKLIASIMLASLFVGLVFVWMSKPSYTAGVDIFVDPRERNLANLDVVPTGLGSSSQGADAALLESQIAILGSRPLLGRLIEKENLTSNPQFAGGGSGGLIRTLGKTLIYGPNAGDYGAVSPFDAALQKLQKSIEIKRVNQTYVLNITVTTGSASLSAELANALAQLYLEDGQSTINNSALEAARGLENRLDDLRKASEASQRAVEAYRSQNNLIGTQGGLTDEQQLTNLNTQLATASIATRAAKAALDEVRNAGATTANPLLSSDLATQLRIQLDQARSQEAVLAGTYGARHPRLTQARQNREALEQALKAELGRVFARAQSEYNRAAETEQSLKTLIAQSEQRVAGSNSASVKLRELEQAAARDRSLYDTFATRAKQAREQIALPATTARIIAPAEPPSRPASPKVGMIFAACLFLGTVAGFGLAWLLYLINGAPTSRPRSRQKPKPSLRERFPWLVRDEEVSGRRWP